MNSVSQAPSPEVDPILTIEPYRPFNFSDITDLWKHRGLLNSLVWRDLKSLHVNSGLGLIWMLLQPLATTFVLTLFLGVFIKVPRGGLPNATIVLSGLVVWTYFSSTVSKATSSLVSNAYLLKKIYFPRVIFPLVQMISSLVDFSVLVFVLIAVCLYYGFYPNLKWLFLPVPILINFLLVLGVSLSLSALNIRYRDIGTALPLVLQLGMYLSPVVYMTSMVPAAWRDLYSLNPIVGVIDGVRWSLLGLEEFPAQPMILAFVVALILIVFGYLLFRKMEDKFADIV